jgi:regulator of replication initiation timing
MTATTKRAKNAEGEIGHLQMQVDLWRKSSDEMRAEISELLGEVKNLLRENRCLRMRIDAAQEANLLYKQAADAKQERESKELITMEAVNVAQ